MAAPNPIEQMVEPRPRDIDGLAVERVLPSLPRQMVGPFIFLDHMGPAVLRPPLAVDVRPHPHIGLATVTYLLEGEIFHRDSLGSAQAIRPGAINLMVAGRGIVHSERTPAELRSRSPRLHGLQLWVALPRDREESAPSFRHHPAETLPVLHEGRVEIRLLIGQAYGVRTPVETFSPLFLADIVLPDGAVLPLPEDHVDRGAYVIEGALEAGAGRVEAGRLAVVRTCEMPKLTARGATRVALLGGEPLGERRHAWWNFVSSSRERIEQAKSDWAARRFPNVPGDEIEFVPLPERARRRAASS
jgi:redox-sensitive bicupin YhaK (pirin superfamily)